MYISVIVSAVSVIVAAAAPVATAAVATVAAIYDLDASRANASDRILAIVLKMCSPELSPLLA